MEARIVAPGDLDDTGIAGWSECAAAAVEPNPFLEPGWLLPALRHLDGSTDTVLVMAEDRGTVHAVVPLFSSGAAESPSGSPEGWAGALWTRGVPIATPLGTPLVASADGLECALEAAMRVARHDDRDPLVVEWIVGDGAVASLLRDAASRVGSSLVEFDGWERAFLRRVVDGDEQYWLRNIGHNRLRTIRQHRRRLEENLGGAPDLQARDDGAAVEDFLRLEMAGWKGSRREGLALGRDPGGADFFREACANLLDEGRLVFLAHEGPGGPIAMICCIRSGEGLFAYRTVYDEALARFGPGVELFIEAMEYFDRETDARWLDSCAAPGNEHLLSLFPDRRTMATMLCRVGHAHGRATDP